MLHKNVPITLDYKALGLEKTGDFQPTMDCYIPYNARTPAEARPAVLIVPGGGYEHTSIREAEPVALGFLERGFNCFVLWYSVSGAGCTARFPTSLLELATAVSIIRENAEEWMTDPKKVFVCGFSAGGHLAASLGTFWNRDFVKNALGFEQEHRPDGLILSYPVVLAPTAEKQAHVGSFRNLLGDKLGDTDTLALLSLEQQVSDATPPAFIWHTATDDVVPVQNSLAFAAAMAKANRPFELHIFPRGDHGLARADRSTATGEHYILPEVQQWIGLAARWAKEL